MKSGNWKQCSEAEKEFEQQKDALTLHNGIIFRGVVPFIPPKLRHLVFAKTHETHPGKNATEASVRMIAWWPGITQDVQHFVSKCRNCQLNKPSLGKTVSTWPEADVWERLHMDWGYVKDQCNILVIVDAGSRWIEAFPVGNRTSETVKMYLSQIFARFGIPKTLVSDNGPEFVSGDLKQWRESLEEAKDICTINTSQGLFKMCRLPQGLKNSSSIFQNCIESTLKGIKGFVIFQDDVLVYGTTKEQFDKRMLAVKSWLREKNFTINEKKSNSKPVDSVSFLGYSISKEGIAPDHKHVEKRKMQKHQLSINNSNRLLG